MLQLQGLSFILQDTQVNYILHLSVTIHKDDTCQIHQQT